MSKNEIAVAAFVAGQSNVLRLGGYGGTVRALAEEGEVRVFVSSPRSQMTLGPDTAATRTLAAQVAERALAQISASRRNNIPSPPRRANASGLLTPREIWEANVECLLSRMPDGFFDWGRGDLEKFYLGLTASARQALPSFDYMNTIILAARRLERDGAVPMDCDFDSLKTASLQRYLLSEVVDGASAHTMRTYFARFRTAVRKFKKAHPERWGSGRNDPTEAVEIPSTAGIKPPEFGETVAAALIRSMRNAGDWQAVATALVASESGRRVGAIAARRPGTQLDAPPLCASDFRRNERGELEVTWRANAAKGDGYDQGDVVQVCSQSMVAAFRWLVRFHPNPLGPGAPLVWDQENPTVGPAYDDLLASLNCAWAEAVGTKKPKGLAYHGFCRTTITTIADAAGTLAAAEHTGRTVETVERIYKRRRPASQAKTARLLDAMRRKSSHEKPPKKEVA